ncbi:DUF6192 family protein [Streptomyces sp. NPDC005279]|uniref:DUF6192 family protein n=1 Tax=Streptomyces sp. NPDC005279 TaxID=3364712 RepID=UPI0036CA57FE
MGVQVRKNDLFTVSDAIRMFAEDVGLAYTTARGYRWVSSRWPKERRRADVSHTIHKVLARIPDEQERFEAVNNPPPNPRGGQPRWTHDSAKRVVGCAVSPSRITSSRPSRTMRVTSHAVASVTVPPRADGCPSRTGVVLRYETEAGRAIAVRAREVTQHRIGQDIAAAAAKPLAEADHLPLTGGLTGTAAR